MGRDAGTAAWSRGQSWASAIEPDRPRTFGRGRTRHVVVVAQTASIVRASRAMDNPTAQTEQEHLANVQAPASAPRQEGPAETISGVNGHRPAAADPEPRPDAANNIAGRRGHGLQEQEGSGQVITRVSKRTKRHRQLDDRKIAALRRTGCQPIDADGHARAEVADQLSLERGYRCRRDCGHSERNHRASAAAHMSGSGSSSDSGSASRSGSEVDRRRLRSDHSMRSSRW